MKKYILSLLAGICLTFNMFAENEKAEFKLRDIATPSVWSLRFQIPWICKSSFSALKALFFLMRHRGEHGNVYHNKLVVHGPDTVFLYAATKYPMLQEFLPKINAAFTKSMVIDKDKLTQFLEQKEKHNAVLTYGDDIDVVLRLKNSLTNQGWSDENVDNSLNELTIKVHNSDDIIAYFEDYLTKNAASLSPEFKEMLDKKINPEKYVPAGYTWNFK